MVITPRRVARPLVLLVAALVWLHAGVASAVTIGDFSWDDYDGFGLFAPFFTVSNFSSDLPGFGGEFSGVFVALSTNFGPYDAPILFEDGSQTIPAGGVAQSNEDLSAFTINSASLQLSFEHGTVFVAELKPELRSTVIDFAPPPPPDSVPVPEPSTFGMVALGLIALWTLRIRPGQRSLSS